MVSITINKDDSERVVATFSYNTLNISRKRDDKDKEEV